jgi:hypothetical protein
MYGDEAYGEAPYAGPAGLGVSMPDLGLSRNLLLLSPSASDAATLTASSQVGTLPVANLQDIQPTRKWRAMGGTASIDIVLASALACDSVAVVAHNFTSAATMRIRGAATAEDVEDSPTVDTGEVSVWLGGSPPDVTHWPAFIALHRWENETALRYWRVDLSDELNEDTWIEAGRLVLGRAWQPSINFDIGGEPLAFDPRDIAEETSYGHTFTDRRTESAPRIFSLTLTAANKREVLGGVQEIQRLRGQWEIGRAHV